MPIKNKLFCIGKGIGIIGLIGYLFYGKVWYGISLLPLLPLYYKKCKIQYFDKQKSAGMMQFKDGMVALNSALSAGYSIENAFRKALEELRVLYGKNGQIVTGFEQIVHKLALNGNVEGALEEFAVNMDLEDAIYFAEVFRYAKRNGGDLTSIIRKTTENINGKLEVKREIETMVTGRQMEQKVMNCVPFAILFYIRMASGEFVEPLYGNLTGVAVMTGCLVIYGLAIAWAEKIVQIEV